MSENSYNPVVVFEGLYKTLGGKSVLNDINLTINENETYVIVGPSGSGKSVLARHINRGNPSHCKPDKGSVYVFGEDIFNISERGLNELRKRIGFVYQEGALFNSVDVGGNIGFILKHLLEKDEDMILKKTKELIDAVGLVGDINDEDEVQKLLQKRISDLSGGMKRRVSLARSLAYGPELLILDEPTAGLDPLICRDVYDLIINVRKRKNGTYVIVTHDLDLATLIADKIFMIKEGEEVYNGNLEKFISSNIYDVKDFLRFRKLTPEEIVERNKKVRAKEVSLESVFD